jgi:hypothetical protein
LLKKQIIVNFRENNVISKLAALVTDLECFSRNVLRILEGKGLAVAWLNTLIDEEIAEATASKLLYGPLCRFSPPSVIFQGTLLMSSLN